MQSSISGVSTVLLVLIFLTFGTNITSGSEQQSTKSSSNKGVDAMNSYVAIIEIPATDITRAISFYSAVLDVKIESMDFPGMQMGILPYQNQAVTAVIVQGEDYTPSSEGITNYLNAGDNLQPMLDKVEPNGGKILVPKTAHADESGFFALFLDSEGNRLGLHSVN